MLAMVLVFLYFHGTAVGRLTLATDRGCRCGLGRITLMLALTPSYKLPTLYWLMGDIPTAHALASCCGAHSGEHCGDAIGA